MSVKLSVITFILKKVMHSMYTSDQAKVLNTVHAFVIDGRESANEKYLAQAPTVGDDV